MNYIYIAGITDGIVASWRTQLDVNCHFIHHMSGEV